jgi:hypothetical protein
MSSCSSGVSFNFLVETFDEGPTTRQQHPLKSTALDASALVVQILDDIHEAADVLNEIYGFVA